MIALITFQSTSLAINPKDMLEPTPDHHITSQNHGGIHRAVLSAKTKDRSRSLAHLLFC
jgi:hypothetical protein